MFFYEFLDIYGTYDTSPYLYNTPPLPNNPTYYTSQKHAHPHYYHQLQPQPQYQPQQHQYQTYNYSTSPTNNNYYNKSTSPHTINHTHATHAHAQQQIAKQTVVTSIAINNDNPVQYVK